MESPVISRNSDVMGVTPVFTGTRVRVQTLLDYLEAGESIDDFLGGHPSVENKWSSSLNRRKIGLSRPSRDGRSQSLLPAESTDIRYRRHRALWQFESTCRSSTAGS